MKKENIRIRDPYILVDGSLYYLYGTTGFEKNIADKNKFKVYVSSDLENFEGPFTVFDGTSENFWGTRDYWAAEVHKYCGKYYLFGSFISDTHRRATQILVSDSPLGPFKVFSDKAITPCEWDCLDGTLYIEGGKPYMVFCHEWTQCINGEIYAVELTSDLCAYASEPFLLFRAGDNPYVTQITTDQGFFGKVTDGPFLFREENKLKMIWSSFCDGKYSVLEATSDSIKSKWTHYKNDFSFEGGHAMVFTDLSGKRFISLHSPNQSGYERAIFIPYNANEKNNR